MAELAGKRVAVIGGGSGIGLAVASAAQQAGAAILLIGRTAERLRLAAAELGDGARWQAADAGDPASVDAALSSFGSIDHLALTVSVSATRLGVQKPMPDVAKPAAEAFMAGKFWAQYWAAQAALPHLAAEGSITFTSGVAARKGLPNHTVMAATNAAIEAMAKQLAREIAPRRVNVVAPGLTATAAYDHLEPEAREHFFALVTGQLPISRPAQPAEIAQGYLFAMTAGYLTGAVLDLDGGLLVH